MKRIDGDWVDRGSLRRCAAALAAASVMLLATAGSVSARTVELHGYTNSFSGGDAVGVSSPAFSSELEKLDVDNSNGTVLVATGDSRIYKFDASGASQPFSALTPNSIITGQSFGQFGDLEIDNSGTATQGRFYAFSEGSPVQAYEPSGEKSTEAQLTGDYCGAAVGADGSFWLAVYGNGFVKYTPTLTPEGVTVHPPPTQTSFCEMDMDSQGFFYVHLPYQAGPVFKFAPNGEELGQIDPGPSQSVAIDRSNNDVYVDDGSKVNHYTSAGQLIETFGTASGPYPGLSSSRGIGVNADTHAVYVANNGSTKAVDRFSPTGSGSYVVPNASADAPSSVTRVSATMTGTVNADGVEINKCTFEWGSTYQYASPSVPCNEGNSYSGASDHLVTAPLAGLTQNIEYHYRLAVENTNGKVTYSDDRTFSTQGAVKDILTKPATNVDRNTVTLTGSFDGEGISTSYWFEYGDTSSSYTTKVPLPAPPGHEVGVVGAYEASENLTGLTTEHTYHYRIAAENNFGISYGKDLSFTTLPAVTGLTTEAATNVTTESAELNGSFTGDGLNVSYYFEWGATTNYGINTPVEEVVSPSGHTTIPPVAISELQPLHTYHYRIVATNITGTTKGKDQTVNTVSAPTIIGLSTSQVTATSADLHAIINPHGAETEYRFEYGPNTQYGTSVPVPDGVIAGGEANEPKEAHLTGLNGGVYHFRVVAHSKYGTTSTVDQSFNFYPPVCPNATVRQQSGSNGLPDCRAYELVTPEDQGITIVYPATLPFSATATSPSRLVFGGSYGYVPNAGEPINNAGDSYVATRTATGWKSKYVGLRSSETSLAGGPPWRLPQGEISAYEPDKWIEDTLTNESLSTLVDWNDGYFSIGELFEETYHTGSSNAPYVWNTSTGEQIDRWPSNAGAVPGGFTFHGETAASADLSHFVFSSAVAFAVGGEPGDVYDNDTGANTIKIASLKASNEHIVGAHPLKVSPDGSHILMKVGGSTEPPPYSDAGELYMRVDDSATYELAPGNAIQYVDMTRDGKKVYFTTSASLVEEDKDTSTDLYMWNEEDPSPSKLTLVSKGIEEGVGNTDSCNASWVEKCGIEAISLRRYTEAQGGKGGSPYSDSPMAADNGDIYFLSPELLQGSNGQANQQNLYVYREGKVEFVAELDPSAVPCAHDQGGVCAESSVGRMEVTPDDTYMSFLTSSNVTPYDSQGHSELYKYTPASHELICVSCVPSGAPPTSDVMTSHNGRFLTDDGRTFFETEDALVPQDSNETGDVYEYADGRPQLITSGTNVGNESSGLAALMAVPGLIGVSADGTDVYFATYDVLVGQDRNGEALKIYDARSGGGFQFTPPIPPCVAADECHGPSSEAPSSAQNGTGSDLGGSGNLQPSRSGNPGKKTKKPRHKRHHKKKAHAKKERRNG